MNNKGKVSLKTIISVIIIIILLWVARYIYCKYNFYDYEKGVCEEGKSFFTRDSSVTFSNMHSYKIENKEYNDAMFYKTIEVTPNTAYRVSCMVKTDDVINLEGKYTGGAQISINDTTECSKAITGTNDWTELTFMFNSNSRTSIEIGFRLGGYEEYSKGTAWFSDFKIEQGAVDTTKNWHMACFIIENINGDVEQNGRIRNVNLQMSNNDISTINNNLKRLQDTIVDISGNNMTITYDVIEITEPLTTLTYDEENEYYASANDVNPLIKEYVDQEEYDYIYVAVRLGDLNQSEEVLVHDWIGLGSMEYNQIGYSNIRMPDNRNSSMYQYSSNNTFPQEVFLHEFLHTLERNEKENGNNIANLHDYAVYGYSEDRRSGLRRWYEDYMRNTINNGANKGLTDFAYSSKPIHESNFQSSIELNDLKEPSNLIEELNSIVDRIGRLFAR